MASSPKRLVSSDVGERRRDGDGGILGFRGPETDQEKLEYAVLTRDRIRAIHEAKKFSSCRLGRENRPLPLRT